MDATVKIMPAFRRVWSDLRTQILRHEFPADMALPTEAEIARTYAVSRQTVRRAFQELVAEDLVYRVPGRGTFATPSSGRYLRHFGSIEDLMALSDDSQLQVFHPLTAAIDSVAAGRLHLVDDHVITMTFLRVHHGEAFSHTAVYLPPHVGAQLEGVQELASPGSVSPVTLIGILDMVLAAPIQSAEQCITVAPAPLEVAGALALPLETPLLRIDRLYCDTEGDPVELAISHFHPDRYSYQVRLRRNQI